MSTRDQLAGSRRIVQREAARLSRIDAIEPARSCVSFGWGWVCRRPRSLGWSA
jgi:hypothetical protein